jgi:hypothetical protein
VAGCRAAFDSEEKRRRGEEEKRRRGEEEKRRRGEEEKRRSFALLDKGAPNAEV